MDGGSWSSSLQTEIRLRKLGLSTSAVKMKTETQLLVCFRDHGAVPDLLRRTPSQTPTIGADQPLAFCLLIKFQRGKSKADPCGPFSEFEYRIVVAEVTICWSRLIGLGWCSGFSCSM